MLSRFLLCYETLLCGLRLTFTQLFEKGLLLDRVLFLSVVGYVLLHLDWLSFEVIICLGLGSHWRYYLAITQWVLSCREHSLFGVAFAQLVPWGSTNHTTEVTIVLRNPVLNHLVVVGCYALVSAHHCFIVVICIISVLLGWLRSLLWHYMPEHASIWDVVGGQGWIILQHGGCATSWSDYFHKLLAVLMILILGGSLWKLNDHLLAVRIKLYLVIVGCGSAYQSIWITPIIISLLKIVVYRDAYRCVLLPALLLEKLTDDVLVDGRSRACVLVLLMLLLWRYGWDGLCRATIVEPVLGNERWLEAFAQLRKLGA